MAPTGGASAIFFLDLWEDDIHIYPRLMQIFLPSLEMKQVLSFKEAIVILLSFTAGRGRIGDRSSNYLLGKNPLLLFWISVNYQRANQLILQPNSFF